MNELTTTTDTISHKIHTIRGLQVMLDRDLVELYGVETKRIQTLENLRDTLLPKLLSGEMRVER